MIVSLDSVFQKRSRFLLGEALDRLVRTSSGETLWLGGSTLRNILLESGDDQKSDVDVFFST